MQASINSVNDESNTRNVSGSGVLGPVMSSLGWPIVLGLVAYWAFLFCIEKEWIASDLLIRYLSAHPVSYVATGMFFVGMAALGLKLTQVFVQIFDLKNVRLSPPPALAQRPDASRLLLDELEQLSHGRQESYLGRRLRSALEFVDKTESANGLEEELKYLAEADLDKQQESFSLTRILIWAIPMLGFLGTVIGISGALGGLSVEADFDSMLSGLKDKLYVAFDTTALALTLSIILMFAQFIVNRVETQLLESVDQAASDQLAGRFVTFGTNRDPYLASVENMANRVMDCMSEIHSRQEEIWDRGLQSIQQATETTLGRFAETMAKGLAQQMDPVLDEFGISIRNAITDSTRFMDDHSQKLAQAMNRSDELMGARQQQAEENSRLMAEGVKAAMQTHAASLQHAVHGSEQVFQSHLEQIHSLMNQTVDLLSQQSQRVQEGIDDSRGALHENASMIRQAIESANGFLEQHTGHLNEVVAANARVMNEHARSIGQAVARSEELVDKRQQRIAETQESMLKAQTQQSMAITGFTEKLQVLVDVVEKAGALERMQQTLNETLESIQESDTIAGEIRGLSQLVREQVRSVDQQQLALVQSSERQLAFVTQQMQEMLEQNADLLGAYQRKTDQLVATLLDAMSRATTVEMPDEFQQTLNSLSLQLVNQNQTLTVLGEKLEQSFQLEPLADRLAEVVEAMGRDDRLGESIAREFEKVSSRLDELRTALTRPTEHQKQFLQQQKQTIENQNQLLDFCQSLEINNRSAFLETAQSILESHTEAARKAVKLEETVRELSMSINLLNQSLASQTAQQAESTMNFNQVDIPRRVA